MAADRQRLEDLLLDWHLGLLEGDDQSWIERELDRNTELREKSDRIGKILQPLDLWRVPSAGPQLVEGILTRIASSHPATSISAGTADDSRRTNPFMRIGLREWLAVAACIVLLVGITIPGVSELRSRSRRALCASNLSGIFRGTSAYQQAFAGALPFAGNPPGSSWLPRGAVDRPYASNSRHPYLLIKLGYVTGPQVFICPTDGSAQPMNPQWVDGHEDFRISGNVSYASLNLSGRSPNLTPSIPVAYMSDANPLFVNARFHPGIDPERTNSPAHRRRGQMVLTLDGQARWMTRPIYGSQRDNLWVIRGHRRYIGIEAPTREDDVQLVPGYPTTDPVIAATLQDEQKLDEGF